MSEEETVEVGLKVENQYELSAYKSYNRMQIVVTWASCLAELAMVAAITFLAWHFDNKNLVWFMLLPALCYMFS